jgi:hypothetical protein
MKLLSLAVRDPFLLVNVFWLLTIAFDGAFAACFQALRIRRLWAVLFGTLYAIIPFLSIGTSLICALRIHSAWLRISRSPSLRVNIVFEPVLRPCALTWR